MLKKILLFLILNFGGLAIGSLFTSSGVDSTWYQELPKAPWTPPGWIFGVAWTTIMVCFSTYLALIWDKTTNKKSFFMLFIIQWVLNVSWNPIFFYFHHILLGLIIITLLAIVVQIFLFRYYKLLKWKSVLLAPYVIWILIATSLNAYIFWHQP